LLCERATSFSPARLSVILGYPKDKQVWLKPGDKIACGVEMGELAVYLGRRTCGGNERAILT
jgi:hypothetical protein